MLCIASDAAQDVRLLQLGAAASSNVTMTEQQQKWAHLERRERLQRLVPRERPHALALGLQRRKRRAVRLRIPHVSVPYGGDQRWRHTRVGEPRPERGRSGGAVAQHRAKALRVGLEVADLVVDGAKCAVKVAEAALNRGERLVAAVDLQF